MAILTKKELIRDVEGLIREVAKEHSMTYDELLLAWAVSKGAVVTKKRRRPGTK
jgi:diketogulonate reductase-like aldo/keto reductase